MIRLLVLIGAFWLAAAFWHQNGGDVSTLWIAVLPASYIVAVTLLMD